MAIAVLALAGCHHVGPWAEVDDDADAAADSDADGDADTDSDSDGDGDADTGGGEGDEDWEVFLTVDNLFDVYVGSSSGTKGGLAGSGDAWDVEYHFAFENRLPTDFLYVVAASDFVAAQGFIGSFTNLTLGRTAITGDALWEVFPAGHYEATNPYHGNGDWPPNTLPTQAQVDIAIAYAEENGLWVAPVGAAGYDNDPTTSVAPYPWQPWEDAVLENIPPAASWVWHQSETVYSSYEKPSPLEGFNHDEFLVFRIAGAIPADADADTDALSVKWRVATPSGP